MPAGSKDMQLVLALLSLEKGPVTSATLASLLANASKKKAHIAPKLLLELWRRRLIVRSERKVQGEYYYFFGSEEKKKVVSGEEVLFVLYSQEKDSVNVKEQIKKILKGKGPATVKEVCSLLRKDFDLVFLKKINFHLQDLFLRREILRSSKPYQYYTYRSDSQYIREEKASLPELLFSILSARKRALFTSELREELTARGIAVKLSAVSLGLKRLCRQQKIVSSVIRFGTRSEHTGYLWSFDEAEIRIRLEEELPANIRELVVRVEQGESIALAEFAERLGWSPVNVLAYVQRLGAQLYFVVEKKFLWRNGSGEKK